MKTCQICWTAPTERLFCEPCDTAFKAGCQERATHPEGAAFTKYFDKLLLAPGSNCWERDVLRSSKEALWRMWKMRAAFDMPLPKTD